MSLEDLRKELSAVDQQLVELIAERQRLVSEIGSDKRASGKGTRDYAREKDVLDMGGEIKIDEFITYTMPLEDINKAFDLMHEGKSIRSVIHY